jgi:cytochrome c
LVEHLVYTERVGSSSLSAPTMVKNTIGQIGRRADLRNLIQISAVALTVISLSPARAADAANGAMVFKKCALCHSVEVAKKSGLGPNLFAVVGRKAGAENFNYSAAMKTSKITWTPAKLDAFLTKPSALVKGSRMAFAGLPNAKDRADVIAYLSAQK